LDRVSQKIEGWRAKTLSQAGRTVLIKSVASTIPSYAMSSFLIPRSISTSLDRIFKNFWWGFPIHKSRNLSLKSWNSICSPKDEGGLGFRKMHDFNLALIAKLGWKLLSNSDCLWVNQLQRKYIKYGDFLSAPATHSSSWLWKGIQRIKPFISAGACLRASRFSSSPVWTTSWIPTVPSFKPTPKFLLNRTFPSLQIMDLINSDNLSWRTSSIHALFDTVSAGEILKLRISSAPDAQYIWTPSTSGQFSTSSVYELITADRSTSSSVSSAFWKSIWKLNLNDRLRLFLWKIAWNILPTKERLGQLFPISDIHCPLCNMAEDSLHHLFFDCFFARVVWRLSFWPLDSTAFRFSSMEDWIAAIISPARSLGIPLRDQHKFQIFASVACDLLWFYRNKAHHDNLTFDARSISIHVNKIALEHFQAWHSSSQVQLQAWVSPPSNWIKINFDTAIRDSFSAQAVICRDSQGQVLHMSSQISPPCTPNVGEARAALLACSVAASLSYSHFIIEGDSEVVIHALNNPNSVRDWRISSVILDCLDTIPEASVWEAQKIKRSSNFCAHSIACWAAARSHSGSIPYSSIPSLFLSPASGVDSLPLCVL
jgi:ribonuclease HI